ncbi:hypothetical protein [Chitinophaga sp. XS-30]|uniref:hypothetical protein n=1 Tax=Chitinophaga sp. XS-30 TaxID=2604421 RepID=UPI0011DE060C|nr:hypothetical protein [Chitinophaga sp. XS-30]QEH42537.1 hypothetical protein FW415_17315 [Chitinophaga sp. XS-30]
MKHLLSSILWFITTMPVFAAEVTGSFVVNGDTDKFYPVTFLDAGFTANAATELEIGRSSVHMDNSWHGALIAKFRFHTYNWGNAVNFIDADLRQNNVPNATNKIFIAGWKDATLSNSTARIIIWLRGGQTTYHYKANYTVTPVVYDGVQNPLPFQEPNGPAITFKTAADTSVNTTGLNYNHTIYANGVGLNYFAGNIGIGTKNTGTHKLAVEGTIGARKVKVQQGTWADFVFSPEHALPSLYEVEKHINAHRHLQGIPSEAEVKREGIDLGEMDKLLLQKIEELTLYMIELKKENDLLKRRLDSLSLAK